MVSSLSYFTDKEKRKRFWEFIKVTASHHPHCEYYEGHVFTIRNVKICRGCSVYYPTSFLAAILIWIIPSTFFNRDPIDLTLIGMIFVLPAIIHIVRLDKILRIDRPFSLFSRLILGFGFGYFIRYLFYVPLRYQLLSILFVFSFFILINLARFITFWNDCDDCPYVQERQKYNNCPGLIPFNSFLNPAVVKHFDIITETRVD